MIKFQSHGDTALATNELVRNQPRRIRGAGGGGKGGKGASNDANTMRSNARFRLIEAISEGPIYGLVNGEQSIYFDQTPLKNADGSYNFKGVTLSDHKGTADEGWFNGHSAVETPEQVEVQVKQTLGPVQRTIVDENADAVRVIMRCPSLVRQDGKGGLKRTSLSYAIDVRSYNGSWTEALVNTLASEKALSPFQMDHRIDLPEGGSPWDVRVRRLTPDSTDDKLQNDLFWEGYVVLVEGKFIYPFTAAVAMEGNAEEMGSNIPPRSYHVRGLLVNVPSNYNPLTRVYTGIWDGTFKVAWTNNPAWIFYDLIVNDRYGLGEFISPEIVDKWSLYTIAQYCDQSIKSGFRNGETGEDIYEPRFTYNGVINTKDEAFFVLQSITKAWRGMAYWAMGQVFAAADMPSDPVRLVSPANVIGGDFEYAGTALKARHSVVMVKWNNPDDFYRPDTEVVINSDLLHKHGWRDKSVQLQGCTSRGLAHRYGKWIIDTEQHETDTLTYSASWDHAELRPGEIIAVSDPRKAQIRAAGRIASQSDLTLELDAPFEWNEGETYQLMATLPSGQVETRPILAFLDERTVRISSAFSTGILPDAMWTIKGSDITPRLYRVLNIEESEPNVFRVTALFHDPNKYARVEDGIAFEPLPYERPTKTVSPPSGLLVKETGYISDEGKEYLSLTLSWTAPQNQLVRGFIVSVDTPNDGFYTLGSTDASYYEMPNISTGIHTFYVQTVGYTGSVSEPATIEFEAAGASGFGLPTVTDLQLIDRPDTTQFTGPDLRVRWKNNFALVKGGPVEFSTSPHYAFNTVSIYHPGTGELLRTERVVGEGYVYDIASNRADCAKLGYAGPTRTIRVTVTVTDTLQRVSNPTTITFSNPVPAAFNPTAFVAVKDIHLSWPAQVDDDFAGVLVWIEKNNTFDPYTTTPRYDGKGGSFVFAGEELTTYYIRVAAYDAFGKTGLNISPALQVATELAFDMTPPAVPTGLAATSVVANGVARVTVTWTNNTEEDMAAYDLQIKQGSGNYVSFPVANGPFEFDGIPAVTYKIKIRARDRNTNTSNYSAEITHVAAKDTTPPAAPTGFTVTPGLTSLWLSWVNPTDADLAFIEILEGTTNVSSSAVVIASSIGTSFPRTGLAHNTTRYYWLRAVDTSGNKSALTAVASAETATLPDPKRMTIVGLTLTPNSPSANKVAWTSFDVSVGSQLSGTTTKTVVAGNATWTSGSLYLYYVEGETTLRTTTSISAIFTAAGFPVGIYRGGTDVQLADGKVMQDGNNILAGTIGAQQLVANNAIITGSVQLGDAVVTSAKIQSLAAEKIQADTTISSSVIVGGDTLGTIRSRAENPAARINAASTLIDPGRVRISNNGTVANWAMGGDSTEINGGAIAANTLAANVAVIGMRNISLDGLQFEHNAPTANRASWTAGSISYINDVGVATTKSITAGSTSTWTAGTQYIYWVKDATALSVTTSVVTAFASNCIVLATYRGADAMNATYGRTVIDGGNIKADTVTGIQMKADTIESGHLKANSINSNHVQANAINSNHVQARSINGVHITADRIDARVLVQDGTTITDLIAANAATDSAGSYANGGVGVGTAAVVVATVSIANPLGAPIIVFADCYGFLGINASADKSYSVNLDVWLRRNGVTQLRSTQFACSAYDTGDTDGGAVSFNYYDAAPGAGTITYEIVAQRSAGSGNGIVTRSDVSQRFLATLVRKR
ncbi:hypothetical protein IB265_33335 [Ensifer sp. ENS10]|uniref:TipJ family phage tail tip protein n=1 Tax=Ensifer sp. ENS10 TaxID=2769286 RepID=UPI001781F863|nr:phage tail protein [Ensifer sp. ENS10]MBD9511641.1 hypothetical protein [Ensifer sp. ENS10]